MWLTFALISTFLVSISSILEKKALFKEHALEFSAKITFYSFLISLPFFIIFIHDFPHHLIPLAIIAITAALGGIAFLFVMKSIRHMEISEISPFIALGPAVTALLGFLFLHESLTLLQVFGLSIIILGIYLLELKGKKSFLSPFRLISRNKYIHLVLISLLLYGTTDVLGKLVLSHYAIRPVTYLFYYQLFLALFFLICTRFQKNDSRGVIKLSKQDIGLVILIAMLTLGYRYAHLSAIKLVSIGIALAIHRSSTLITTVIGGKLYKEERLARKSIAAIAVVIGIILIAS